MPKEIRLTQICAAHYAQEENPVIYGLDRDGKVYEYQNEFKPRVTMMQVMKPCTPEEYHALQHYARPAQQNMRYVKNEDGANVYAPLYHDGSTAGWKLLEMQIVSPVPHPEDPTRNERV